MDLNGFKWHGTLRQLEELMADTGGMLDDSKGWNVASQKEMEEYTATTFIAKARHYLKLTPPDLVQSAEKIWFAAVYAVKQLYLTCGGIDLKSHQTLTRFCDFAIETSGKEEENRRSWVKSWKDAQKMHRDVYGSGHFKRSDYEEVIINVEAFVNALGGFDPVNLFKEFKKTYPTGTNDDVSVTEKKGKVKLGGRFYDSELSVFVP